MKIILKNHLVLFVWFLACLTTTAQQSQILTTIDTLHDGRAMVTIQKHDSSFFARYLINQKPFDGITGKIAETVGTQESATEYLVKNIEIPNEFGGCFPQEAIYDKERKNYYIYAGRKVFVVDAATHEKSDEIVISNTDRSGIDATNFHPEKRLAINYYRDKLYCTTEQGTLIIINLITNQVDCEIDPGIPYQQLIKASVVYDTIQEMAYWYVSTANSTNRVGKVDGISNEEIQVNTDIQYGINDMVISTDGNRLYICTTAGIFEFQTSAINGNYVIVESFNCLSAFYTPTNILYAGKSDTTELFFKDYNPNGIAGEIQIDSISGIYKLEYNSIDSTLFCLGTYTGINSNSGVRVINTTTQQVIPLSGNANYNDLHGIRYSVDNNMVYIGGQDTIICIAGATNSIYATQSTANHICNDISVASDTSGVNLLTIFNFIGNAEIFNAGLNPIKTIPFARYVVGGCIKSNYGQAFFATTSRNYQSTLWVYDLDQDTMINSYDIPGNVNAITIDCHQNDQYIFVAGNNENDCGKVFVFDLVNNVFLNPEIGVAHTIIKMLCASNGKTYICGSKNSSQPIERFYVMNEYGVLNSQPFPDSSGTVCFGDFFYQNNMVYLNSKCSKDIFMYNCLIDAWVVDTNFMDMDNTPFSICLDNDTVLIVGSADAILYYNLETYEFFDTITTNKSRNYDKLIVNPYNKKLYTVSYSNYITIFENKSFTNEIKIDTYEYGYAYYNKMNDQIYLYSDDNPQLNVQVDVIDCNKDILHHTIDAGIYSRYIKYSPGYTDSRNPVFLSDVNSTSLFCINTALSCISQIRTHTDRLTLQTGWNWLSFPRLERAGNDPFSTEQTLNNINYFPDVELRLNENGNNYKRYNNNQWSGYLDSAFSSIGYKLNFEILGDGESPNIALYGGILDPDTEVTLYPGTDNWVGYFIEDAQMPLEAIPAEVLAHVIYIKTQYWAMFKGVEELWLYKGSVTPIKYGQMVKLYVDTIQTLTWNNPQAPAEAMSAPETVYFEFEEQADYLPLFVETDSTSAIQEIAVLANGEVKGAAVRRQGDTLTQVSAYLEGVPPGTPLTFETWEGYKSVPSQKTGYAVYNPARKTWEPRTLYHGEHANYHVVSLKAVAAEVSSMAEAEVSCAPNPFNSETTFTLRVNQTACVSLTIRDINGQTVATLLNSRVPDGLYQATWDGTGSNGAIAGNGVYCYHLIIDGKQRDSGKIVLIR